MEATKKKRRKETEYCRFKVGLGPEKKLYICRVKNVMRHPESTLAKCLALFKQDGRTKGDYIEIPHEGKYFKQILRYMAGDEEPLRECLVKDEAIVRKEMGYHCLNIIASEVPADNRRKTTKICKPEHRIDVFHDICHLITTIEYTAQPQLLIFNYVMDRKSFEGELQADRGAQYMKTLMNRVDPMQCRVIGFEGDLLGLGEKHWQQSALLLAWREQPEYGLNSDKWYHNLAFRKCLVEQRRIHRSDITALMRRIETHQ